jgi:hypothetical protein
MRRRRERGRVVGIAASALVAVPLLFAAVWVRVEVTEGLKAADDLRAERTRLEREVLELGGRLARLATWDRVEPRARRLGLRPPEVDEVMWVSVPATGRREG